MSERIIIEHDGRRWEVIGDGISIGKWNDTDCLVVGNFTRNIHTGLKPLPPVSQTENSAKCDCKDCSFRGMELCEHRKLLEENAELNRTIDDNLRVAKACRDSDQDEKFELRQERSRLICENAKLREALKPILEVNSDFRIYKAILCHETDKLFFLQEAVQKAKDIMNKKEE